MRQYIVRLGWKDLTGERPTWELVKQRFADFSLLDVLAVLGRITCTLDAIGGDTKRQRQMNIYSALFPHPNPMIQDSLAPYLASEKMFALFDRSLVLNSAKVAFLLKDLDTTRSVGDFSRLAEALLMITDLVGEQEPRPNFSDGMPDLEAAAQYLLANGIYNSDESDVWAIPRFSEIYLEPDPDRPAPERLDLAAICKDVTGLPADLLKAMTFLLASTWNILKKEQIAADGTFAQEGFLTQSFDFTDEEVRAFHRFYSWSAFDLQRRIRQSYRLDDIRPFDVLPFEQRPLVLLGGRIVCLSLPLIVEKHCRGIHYLYLDQESRSPAERHSFLIYVGTAFENAVHRTFERIFPPISGRYYRIDRDILPSAGVRANSQKHVDGLIDYGDALIFLEFKAPRFTIAARAGIDKPAYDLVLKKIFFDSAPQFDGTIALIESGKCPAIDPARIHSYFCVLVTFEDLPINPFLMRLIHRKWSQGDESCPKARHVQVLDFGELARLEAYLEGEAPTSFASLLNEKLSEPELRAVCFAHVMNHTGRPTFFETKSKYERERFDRFFDESKELLDQRAAARTQSNGG